MTTADSKVQSIYNLYVTGTLRYPNSGKADTMDDDTYAELLVIVVTVSTLICIFGVITNVMNMAVFFKQGFHSSSNISFFALALSDICCLITAEWYEICVHPSLTLDVVPFIPHEIQYLTLGWFNVCFCRVTNWITVIITAERCMGIALPLKVKQIVTLKGTTVFICATFIINVIIITPEYCIAYYDWKFVPERNKSFVGLVYRGNKNDVFGLVFILTSASGLLSFITLIILTIFLVVKLGQISSEQFKTNISNTHSDTRSIRDKKTVKMVVVIASILIACYIPGITGSLVTAFEPEFMIGAKYANPFFAFWAIAYFLGSINSSVNMILYYNMSTKYRQTFNELFGRGDTSKLKS